MKINIQDINSEDKTIEKKTFNMAQQLNSHFFSIKMIISLKMKQLFAKYRKYFYGIETQKKKNPFFCSRIIISFTRVTLYLL